MAWNWGSDRELETKRDWVAGSVHPELECHGPPAGAGDGEHRELEAGKL